MEVEERAANINGYLNDGLGFVNWFGHGNPTYWDPWYNSYNIQLAFYRKLCGVLTLIREKR